MRAITTMHGSVAIAALIVLLLARTVQSYRSLSGGISRHHHSQRSHLSRNFKKTQGRSILRMKGLGDPGDNNEQVVVEITTKRPFTSSNRVHKMSSVTYEEFDQDAIESYDDAFEDGRVYQEYQEETKVEKVLDSSAGKFLGILLQPSTLLLFMWAAGNWSTWMQKTWVQKFLKIFGRGKLAKNSNDPDAKPVVLMEDLPFQTFECEKCQMQMKPAKGRAEVIFGKARFRCSRCGSKADAYFDIDDMTDPRAVARAERVRKEEERRSSYEDLEEDEENMEDDEDGDYEGGDDEDE